MDKKTREVSPKYGDGLICGTRQKTWDMMVNSKERPSAIYLSVLDSTVNSHFTHSHSF